MSRAWMARAAFAIAMGSPPAALAQAAAATARGTDPAAAGPGCASTGITLRDGSHSGKAPVDGGTVLPAGALPLDTTIVLAIRDRTWSREHVDAGVALGAAGRAGSQSAPWHACAGATAQLRSVSILLRQVYGTIHLRLDPGTLASVGTGTRITPPVGPPRR